MEIYLVGGAVRNELLGLPIKDYDYVVVGSSVKEMLELGYEQVGSFFPVFLHPITKQEYALARLERSNGDSHIDFDFEINGVSLKDDLERRDLTINAIVKNGDDYIDYFNGLNDIKTKTLRHISMSFCDDPLRILRVARFASCLDFNVARHTIELMTRMNNGDMLSSISAERFKGEFDKALMSNRFEKFYDVLKVTNSLKFLKNYFNFNNEDFSLVNGISDYDTKIVALMLLNDDPFLTNTIIGQKLFKFKEYIHNILAKDDKQKYLSNRLDFCYNLDMDKIKLINNDLSNKLCDVFDKYKLFRAMNLKDKTITEINQIKNKVLGV